MIPLSTISPLQVRNDPDFGDLGFFYENVTFCDAHKMKTNSDSLRLRGYSRWRKAELIAFLWDNPLPMPSPRPS